jgi:hypothetical protein
MEAYPTRSRSRGRVNQRDRIQFYGKEILPKKQQWQLNQMHGNFNDRKIWLKNRQQRTSPAPGAAGPALLVCNWSGRNGQGDGGGGGRELQPLGQGTKLLFSESHTKKKNCKQRRGLSLWLGHSLRNLVSNMDHASGQQTTHTGLTRLTCRDVQHTGAEMLSSMQFLQTPQTGLTCLKCPDMGESSLHPKGALREYLRHSQYFNVTPSLCGTPLQGGSSSRYQSRFQSLKKATRPGTDGCCGSA